MAEMWVKGGTINWLGDNGGKGERHKGTSKFERINDGVRLTALANGLSAYTNAVWDMAAHIYRVFETTASPPGLGVNMDRRAIIYFRDEATLEVCSVTLPAPKDSIVEETEQGQRVKAADVAAIVQLIEDATNGARSYSPLYGLIVQKR
jgi:hypothetical protein